MKEKIDHFRRVFILKRVLRALDLPDDQKRVDDFYYVTLTNYEGERYARLVGVEDDALLINRIENGLIKDRTDNFGISFILAGRSLSIERSYYGEHTSYRSEVGFVLTDWWLPYIKYFLDRLLQKRYERALKIRYDRIEVMESILEKTISRPIGAYEPPKAFKVYDIVESISGSRIRKHSTSEEIYTKYRLLLDSLVMSGELELIGKEREYSYRITGKAITTLSHEATEERRHRDMKRLTTWLVGLTVGLIITGLMAAPWNEWFDNSVDQPSESIDNTSINPPYSSKSLKMAGVLTKAL